MLYAPRIALSRNFPYYNQDGRFELPFPDDDEVSGGTLVASANNVEKYTAQITLSAANPAVKTEGEMSRASDMAT